MKTSLIFAASLMCLTLAACSNNGGGSGSKNANSPVTPDSGQTPDDNIFDDQLKNVTDLSLCNRGLRAKSIQGNWQANFTSKSFDVESKLSISKNMINFSNTCSKRKLEVTANVKVPSRVDRNILYILGADEDHQQGQRRGQTIECKAQLSPANAAYTFQGSCLVLHQPGDVEPLILIPAKADWDDGKNHPGPGGHFDRNDKVGQDDESANQNDDQSDDSELIEE